MNTIQCVIGWLLPSTDTSSVDSFNAELVMVQVETAIKRTPEVALDMKQYNLVIKFLPIDELQKEVIKRCGYHIKELQMYAVVAQELNSFQAARSED